MVFLTVYSLRSGGWSWNDAREKYCWTGRRWSWWLEWCEKKILLGWSWSWLLNGVTVATIFLVQVGRHARVFHSTTIPLETNQGRIWLGLKKFSCKFFIFFITN